MTSVMFVLPLAYGLILFPCTPSDCGFMHQPGLNKILIKGHANFADADCHSNHLMNQGDNKQPTFPLTDFRVKMHRKLHMIGHRREQTFPNEVIRMYIWTKCIVWLNDGSFKSSSFLAHLSL